MENISYEPSRTTEFFYKINMAVYIFGLPNFWIEELKLPKKFIKFYDKFTIFNNTLISLLLLNELGAFFTQKNLNEKQKYNLLLYGISHPTMFLFNFILANLEKQVRLVIYNLTVRLKKVYNDPQVEKEMIASTVRYLIALVLSCCLSMLLYTVDACLEVARHNMTFTTIVTAYPDVEDRSGLANVVRAMCYMVWWLIIAKVFGVYSLVLPLVTCLSHQYKNLQSYFLRLSGIFERDDLSQEEKEAMYEEGFKIGIKMHSETLRCTHETQVVCRAVFSGQIIFNNLLLVVLMGQMVPHLFILEVNPNIRKGNSERTLMNLCATVLTASAVLISTGFYMWNAGDVTVEASRLATAMYSSGWHHTQGSSSVRLRKLVVVTITHSQRPVVLKGFGYIDLSYQSYIRIVKSSYSVFSVLF